VYINDIGENVQSTSHLFADDTSVFSSLGCGGAIHAIDQLNKDLHEIHCWANKWLISIHPKKTVAMLFSLKKHPSVLPPIYLGDQLVSLVPVHSHLGVTLTPTLSWSEHINKMSSKCYKILGVLKKFKYRWTRRTLETCYLSFVRPIIEYADILYDSCGITDSSRLESVQLEAARLVTGAKRGTSHSALYRELGWLTLKERRKIHKLVKIYKIVNRISPDYLCDIIQSFQSKDHHHTRFHAQGCLKIPFCRTAIHKNSPFISGLQLWNRLDVKVKGACSLIAFKHCLKSWFPSKPAPFYHISNRSLQVSFTQIRLGFSNLNDDLAIRNCIPDPKCPCGYQRENANHFLLQCPLYSSSRTELYAGIYNIQNSLRINVNLLLYGSQTLCPSENETLFILVYKYIESTRRF
jgi:hypothetical protein